MIKTVENQSFELNHFMQKVTDEAIDEALRKLNDEFKGGQDSTLNKKVGSTESLGKSVVPTERFRYLVSPEMIAQLFLSLKDKNDLAREEAITQHLNQVIKTATHSTQFIIRGDLPKNPYEYGALINSVLASINQIENQIKLNSVESDFEKMKQFSAEYREAYKSLIGNEDQYRSQKTIEEVLGNGGMGKVFVYENQALKILFEPKSYFENHEAFEGTIFQDKELFDDVQKASANENAVSLNGEVVFEEVLPGGQVKEFIGHQYEKLDELTELKNLPWLSSIPRINSPETKKLLCIEALKLMRQILKGLEAFHNRKIVHRDIKLGNFILHKNQGKILDYDLCVRSGFVNTTGQIMGTPSFMSPEQWSKDLPQTTASDIFSLGKVFYQIFGGRMPNLRRMPMEDVARLGINAEHLTPISELPVDYEFKLIVKMCCQKDPKKRPTITELIRYVDSVIERYEKLSADPVRGELDDKIQLGSSMPAELTLDLDDQKTLRQKKGVDIAPEIPKELTLDVEKSDKNRFIQIGQVMPKELTLDVEGQNLDSNRIQIGGGFMASATLNDPDIQDQINKAQVGFTDHLTFGYQNSISATLVN